MKFSSFYYNICKAGVIIAIDVNKQVNILQQLCQYVLIVSAIY